MPNTASFQLPQEFLIVGAAVQTGLFEELKNAPCTLEELAMKTKIDQRALWTVVEALVVLEYLEYDDNKVKLSEEADNILFKPSHERYTGFSFMHAYNLMKAWIQLPEVMFSGKPVSKKDAPRHTKDFIRAMSHHARQSALQIADYCLKDLPAGSRVLDVGGGPLTYAIAFAGKGAVVTILDLPEVIDMMQPELDKNLPATSSQDMAEKPAAFSHDWYCSKVHVPPEGVLISIFTANIAGITPVPRIISLITMRPPGVSSFAASINSLLFSRSP